MKFTLALALVAVASAWDHGYQPERKAYDVTDVYSSSSKTSDKHRLRRGYGHDSSSYKTSSSDDHYSSSSDDYKSSSDDYKSSSDNYYSSSSSDKHDTSSKDYYSSSSTSDKKRPHKNPCPKHEIPVTNSPGLCECDYTEGFYRWDGVNCTKCRTGQEYVHGKCVDRKQKY